MPTGLDNPTQPAHCHSNAMFAAPAGNVYGASYYGTAAVSQALGGEGWMSPACGKCWKVTGKSIYGVSSTLVLKGANYCPPINPGCSNGPHFDIAAPGFDVLEWSMYNNCASLEPGELNGFYACGRWMIDNQDPNANCDCSKFKDPILRNGCQIFSI